MKTKVLLVCPREMADTGATLARGLGVSRNRLLVEAVSLGYGPAVEVLRHKRQQAIDSEIESVMQRWRRFQERENGEGLNSRESGGSESLGQCVQ